MSLPLFAFSMLVDEMIKMHNYIDPLFYLNRLQMFVIVQGLYQVEVRLLGYENPTQRCQGCRVFGSGVRSCCDDFSRSTRCVGDRKCDSYFIYCLRAFQTRDSQEGGCPNSDGTVTSAVNTDDGMIDFSQDIILGLENSFQFQGLTKDYTVSLKVSLHALYASFISYSV